MKQTFYTIYDQQSYKLKSELFDHYIFENEKTRIIVPVKFHKKSVNPVNFLQLKIKYKIKKIVILDRTKANFKKASIVGQVNRSGFNFFKNTFWRCLQINYQIGFRVCVIKFRFY